MPDQFNYTTKLDIKFKHFERIDIPQMVKGNKRQMVQPDFN